MKIHEVFSTAKTYYIDKFNESLELKDKDAALHYENKLIELNILRKQFFYGTN